MVSIYPDLSNRIFPSDPEALVASLLLHVASSIHTTAYAPTGTQSDNPRRDYLKQPADGIEIPGTSGRSPLLVIFITVFIDLVGFGIIIPILPFYAQAYGASKFQIGVLFASYSLMQFIFSPVWGRVSDRIGRRPILLLCLFGTAVAFTIFGLAESLLLLFLGRITAGLFGAVIATAYAFIADVTPPRQRAAGMGLVGAAFGLGFIFGPFIGGMMADLWGYAAPAYFAAGLALANLVLAWFVLPESLPVDAMRKGERTGRAGPTLNLKEFQEALRKPLVGGLLVLFFLVTFALANMESTYALLTEEIYGWGARENGLVFGYVGIVMVIVQGMLIGPLARRYGEKLLVIAGTTLLVPSLGLLPFAPSLGILLLLSGIMAFGSGISVPSISSLISQGVSPEEQGGIMGVTQSLGSLARVVGPLWGGFTFGTISHTAPYWSAAILMAGAVLIARGVIQTHPLSKRVQSDKPG